MTTPKSGPRKRRTRQHVIADLSVHHVEGFVLEEGHTVQRFDADYGYDLALYAYDKQGFVEPDAVYLQVKATESLRSMRSHRVFDLDGRDYNLWITDRMPVILVLFDVSQLRGYWLHIQGYFSQEAVSSPRQGARTVRVRVPNGQVLDRHAIASMRRLKRSSRDLRIMREP